MVQFFFIGQTQFKSLLHHSLNDAAVVLHGSPTCVLPFTTARLQSLCVITAVLKVAFVSIVKAMFQLALFSLL